MAMHDYSSTRDRGALMQCYLLDQRLYFLAVRNSALRIVFTRRRVEADLYMR
jgi:hypothetical protein